MAPIDTFLESLGPLRYLLEELRPPTAGDKKTKRDLITLGSPQKHEVQQKGATPLSPQAKTLITLGSPQKHEVQQKGATPFHMKKLFHMKNSFFI